jgi:c-src tyrosine kinase
MGNYNSSQPIHVSRPEVIEQHANMNLLKQFKFYNAADIKIINTLSHSPKGTVYTVEYQNKQLCAKYLGSQIEFEHELFMYSLIHQKESPAITKILGISQIEHKYVLLLELLSMGSLENFVVKQSNRLSLNDTIQVLLDIAEGLCFLHSNDIIYRDLALRNILLYRDDNNNALRAKITDFGWSQQKLTKDSAINGPYRILSPESIKEAIFNEKTDMWSFGILLYSLLTYERPYSDIALPLQVKEAIEAGRRLTIDSTV